MELTNLMLTDWVYVCGSEAQISRLDLKGFFKSNADGGPLDLTSDQFDDRIVKPIPLTEDILKVNEFYKLKENQNYAHYRLRVPELTMSVVRLTILVNRKDQSFSLRYDDKSVVTFRYVHELQHILRLFNFMDVANNLTLK